MTSCWRDFLRRLISRPTTRRRESQVIFGIHTFFAIRSTRRTSPASEWQQVLQELEEQDVDKEALKELLDGWFGDGNQQVRTAIEQAAAIVFYRHQSSVPVIETIVCDDAGQFKLLTENLSLCWIHAGRHYEKLSPVVPRHAQLLESFLDQYWDYYHRLQCCGAQCTASQQCF